MTRKIAMRRSGRISRQKGVESIIKVEGTQAVRTYINRRQVTMAQWVALQPIFKVYAQQETYYEGGGRRRPPWWRKKVVYTQLWFTLE